MNFDARNYRQTLGLFTTGISVVTLPMNDSYAIGITINSLTSVSLEPPLILFCIKRTAESYARVMSCPRFAINILSQNQRELAMQCTMKGGNPLPGDTYDLTEGNIPLIKNSLATLECERQDIHQGGDHSIIVAKVLRLHKNDGAKDPLVFFQSEFTTLAKREEKDSFLKAV